MGGSKWAPFARLSTPFFDPFFDVFFFPQNGPFSTVLWCLLGPKWVKTGSKWARFTCLCIPKGQGSLLEKCVFDPFLTDFWSQNGLLQRHFGVFGGPKRLTTGSKLAKNTSLSILHDLGTTFEKSIFFALGTLPDPPLAPAACGPGCPLDPTSDHWYWGLGVSLGDSEG